MHISLDETQLETLEAILKKITQSFEKFSETIKELTISIDKLAEEVNPVRDSQRLPLTGELRNGGFKPPFAS